MRKFIILTLLLCSSLGFSQNPRLAENYIDQGEYGKALKIYNKIYSENKRNVNNLLKVIDINHQLEQYQQVDSLLDDAQKLLRNNYGLTVERGYNLTLQGKDSLAKPYYNEAITILDSLPNLTYQIANRFERRNLLDEAIEAYERGMAANPKANFRYQLANLYGQQGNVEKMFIQYVDLIEENVAYRGRAQAIFTRYVTDDPDNEGNKLLRKTLLLRLRENQNPIYNQLLSWLFIQQKDFKKAFIQEKAIYVRTKESTVELQELAVTAIEEKDVDAAKEILEYLVQESQVISTRYVAQSLLAKIDADKATATEFPTVKAQYEELLTTYGRDGETFMLQLDYANFLAFKAGEPDTAVTLLSDLENKRLSKFQKAEVKMLLADILVLQEQFNRALILYSQVQTDLPNDELAQEAQFRVARTSYYQGDFPWSLTQLKVLRSATSKLIANDAMELSLTISDHSLEDTTFVALKAYSYADLKQYQNRRQEAIALYDKLLQNHKGDPIEDEALLKQAQLYELESNFEAAKSNYQTIIDNFADGILADDAYYYLGLLFEEKFNDNNKAQAHFERIIYDYADSIHFVDARRRFRRLRGDENVKAF
ncbi:MAG: tetratricopeptide repeat protein [Nonlabens sp.]|uniref:tetratricopeptide repeat protein n=1 Tax=Nonlabens sp. TaxID=1888209 RepID=UPI003EF25FD6